MLYYCIIHQHCNIFLHYCGNLQDSKVRLKINIQMLPYIPQNFTFSTPHSLLKYCQHCKKTRPILRTKFPWIMAHISSAARETRVQISDTRSLAVISDVNAGLAVASHCHEQSTHHRHTSTSQLEFDLITTPREHIWRRARKTHGALRTVFIHWKSHSFCLFQWWSVSSLSQYTRLL